MVDEAAQAFGIGASISFFIAFMGIVWWVLCIILFFKVWGMTNDVSKIRDMFEEWFDLEHPLVEADRSDGPIKQNGVKEKVETK